MKLFSYILFFIFLNSICILSVGQVAGTPYIINITPNPIISTFTSDNSTIVLGSTTTITPVFAQGTATIDNGIGVVNSTLSYTISPTVTTTYTLTVTNNEGKSVSQTLTIYVNFLPTYE